MQLSCRSFGPLCSCFIFPLLCLCISDLWFLCLVSSAELPKVSVVDEDDDSLQNNNEKAPETDESEALLRHNSSTSPGRRRRQVSQTGSDSLSPAEKVYILLHFNCYLRFRIRMRHFGMFVCLFVCLSARVIQKLLLGLNWFSRQGVNPWFGPPTRLPECVYGLTSYVLYD